MKFIYTLAFILCFPAFAKAQDSSKEEVEPPQIAMKLPLGATIEIDEVLVTFHEVIEDSRCPQDASCIWAGQAKVRIELQKSGEKSTSQIITFNPGLEVDHLLWQTPEGIVAAVDIKPLTLTTVALKDRKYYLLLKEQKKK